VRYLVAVSGGVDSVVLLDQLAASGEHELVVAHFDHGIRTDSAEDARFVEGLARQYGLLFVSAREELGAGASEELARRSRYAFLRSMAATHAATIATAHHADDVVETIAINVKRGTGWRGLAVLDSTKIVRPLLHLSKTEIISYALQRQLEWVEDSTNASDKYLRNRLRHLFARQLSLGQKEQILALWQRQVKLRRSIDHELDKFFEKDEYSRYELTNADETSAAEILRAVIVAKTNVSPTRPQLERAIMAIKTARPHTTFEVGSGVRLKFTIRTFIVETL
jgi:tRNA(Ile)-lysidine synthase